GYIDEEEKENAIGANKLIYVDHETNKKTLFKDLKVVTEKNIKKDFEFDNKKQGEKTFRTSKKQLFALVYENKEGQLSSVPINFLLKKFGSKLARNFYSLDESNYDQENLKKYKDSLVIEHHSKPIIAIKISAIVKLKVDKKISFVSKDEKGKRITESIPIRADGDHYFYISGISKEKDDDTKFTVKSIKLKGLEYSGCTNPFLNHFQFVSLDELGTEYE
ncbi:hypothetical protein, partial [Mesomycoplasma ovipneumoniae]|uniref:hypothetical protein n=1 Tax=Mesomycoplasma ovipneumoniae TaxID=29562 RepID=UPI0030802D73